MPPSPSTPTVARKGDPVTAESIHPEPTTVSSPDTTLARRPEKPRTKPTLPLASFSAIGALAVEVALLGFAASPLATTGLLLCIAGTAALIGIIAAPWITARG